MYTILLPLLFIFTAMVLQGISHAILYSGKSVNAFQWNEHIIFNLERINWGMIGFSCSTLVFNNFIAFKEPSIVLQHTLLDIGFMGVAAWLSLSFWHNGAYGIALFRILTKKAGFWLTIKMWAYTSDHSTAKYDYDFGSRSLMFVIACIIITIRIITY